MRALSEPGALPAPLALERVAGVGGLDRVIAHTRIQKSGLALVGHFEGLSSKRVQILGVTEMTFLAAMTPVERAVALRGFLARRLPCVIVTASITPFSELVAACDEHECPLLRSNARSSVTINEIHTWLDDQLALRTRIHGVFVDVFGVGILLLGKSGIGKSECALELVQRGHRLVADDVVDCTVHPPDRVYGVATELLKNHLEVRGLGVLNVKDLFGVASVRDTKRVDLVVRLLSYDDDESWDRLGIDDEWYEVLGVRIPLRRLPVRPGKNTASTVEVAARNELLRREGVHSAREFHARLARALGVPDPTTTAEPTVDPGGTE